MRKNSAVQRRRRGRRRLTAQAKVLLAGLLVAGCLLMGAKRQPEQAHSAAAVLPPAAGSMEPAVPETPDAAPDLAADWRLALVNPWNALPKGREIALVQLKNGQSVDERCYPDLQEMMDDCRGAGLDPVICSSYRTWETQERLFQNQVDKLLSQGYGRAEAEREAGRAVAVPGTSEHQLGLAVDVVDRANQNLNESQEDTAVQQWLMENSWKYGFVLRYPSGKSALTGIIYEPWHYRYVGRDAAREIYEQGVCLEEYLEQRSGQP